MIIVDDFKKDKMWVRSFVLDKQQIYTKAGTVWSGVLRRTKVNGWVQQNETTYVGSVNGFADFQSFAGWCQEQIGYADGYHLDKDILQKGNSVYCEGSCIFVPQEINNLFTKSNKSRGDLPVGVTKQPKWAKFMATISVDGKNQHLGGYATPEDAFLAYKKAKEAHIKTVANKWKDKIDPRAYNALMNYQVEITD